MPDANRFSLLRQNISAVMAAAGQTAMWRDYISASAGAAEFGMGTAIFYIQKPLTALFQPLRPQEIQAAGGFYLAGDIRMTTFEPVSKRDEITWEGSRYAFISDPAIVNLWGQPASESVIRRA